MVLVDSSIYIQLLRARKNPADELAASFGSTELVTCSVVRCEVMRGVIEKNSRIHLGSFFDLLIHVATDHRTWAQVEELAWQLDRAGKILPLSDLIIAVCAMRAGASVLTRDQHFSVIPGLALASW